MQCFCDIIPINKSAAIAKESCCQMDNITKQHFIVTAIILSVSVLAWSIWMIRRHVIKKDSATKYRHPEILMLRPFLFCILGPFLIPVVGAIAIIEIVKGTSSMKEMSIFFVAGLLISIFFVLYGTRWILIYDSKKIRYRPIFGKIRTYDFNDIRFMIPIFFDLLVHVGKRFILIDIQQDWHPLWDKYHYWRIKNGLPVKKRVYKTALGREFGSIPGGISILIGLIAIFAIPIILGFYFAILDRSTGGLIVMSVFAILCFICLFVVFYAVVNKDKHPRFSKRIIGDFRTWGRPRRALSQEKTRQSAVIESDEDQKMIS